MDDDVVGKRPLKVGRVDRDAMYSDHNDASHPLLELEEPDSAAALRELRDAVARALGRYAINGELEIAHFELQLTTPRGRIVQDARLEIIRWNRQDAALREQTAARLARQLAAAVPTGAAPRSRVFNIDRSTWALALFACVLVSGLLYFDFDSSNAATSHDQPSVEQKQSAQASLTTVVPKRKRSVEVCETTRARIFRGGLISMADAEGWVVELSLTGSNAPMLEHRALGEFFADIRKGHANYSWKDEPQLAHSAKSAPPIQLQTLSFPSENGITNSLTFSFSGSYVESYFDELNREKFYHLAHRLSSALKAKHTALYARCAHDQIHTLGSWFRGESAQGAAASLLYFIGSYASPAHVSHQHLAPPGQNEIDRAFSFTAITTGTAHIDRAALSMLVGSEGGMATGDGNDAVIITFPFRDGNRASRVSRTLARVTGMEQ